MPWSGIHIESATVNMWITASWLVGILVQFLGRWLDHGEWHGIQKQTTVVQRANQAILSELRLMLGPSLRHRQGKCDEASHNLGRDPQSHCFDLVVLIH